MEDSVPKKPGPFSSLIGKLNFAFPGRSEKPIQQEEAEKPSLETKSIPVRTPEAGMDTNTPVIGDEKAPITPEEKIPTETQ